MESSSTFTPGQLEDMRETFDLFDTAGDGKIHASLVGDCVRALGLSPILGNLKKYSRHIKKNERVTFDKFLQVYEPLYKKSTTSTAKAEDFVGGFRLMDAERTGLVSAVELRHLLTNLGEPLSHHQVDLLINHLTDEDGNVKYEEFIKKIMSHEL